MKTEREKEESHSENEARAQLESIKEMVTALECDYDRLEELRSEYNVLCDTGIYPTEDELEELRAWKDENSEEYEELKKAAGDCESREDAYERIHEEPLSIEVRSNWHEPGGDNTPGEFRILLCSGDPAVRIVGDLEHGEPTCARLEHQDWFKPWTELICNREDYEALLTYARCFYYGD